jgi:hypothetical protein
MKKYPTGRNLSIKKARIKLGAARSDEADAGSLFRLTSARASFDNRETGAGLGVGRRAFQETHTGLGCAPVGFGVLEFLFSVHRSCPSMQETDYPCSPPSPHQHKYPKTVRAAGSIWIFFGCVIIANGLMVLLPAFGLVGDMDSGNAGGALVGKLVGGLFQGVIGGFFLYEGIESCRGTISTTVGIAVGSIGIALIFVAIAVFQPVRYEGVSSALLFIPAGGLLVAGVLGLMGQVQYDAWWKVHRVPRGKRGRDEVNGAERNP